MRAATLGPLVVIPIVVALTALVPPAHVSAQVSGTATVRGTVLDSTGGVVPGAGVVLVNEADRERREATTDERGTFTFSSVYAGTYSAEARLEGFKPVAVRGVQVSAADGLRLELTLEIGSQTDTVVVSATPQIVRQDSGAREHVVDGEQLQNLSLVGRSAVELLRVLPGVVGGGIETMSFADGNGFVFVNGFDPRLNTITVDGTHSQDIGSALGSILTANVDMLQEVKVQTAHYAAEYGTGAVQISAVTRRGSSQFHGTMYDYLRNWRLASNDRTNEITGIPKPRSSFQYPGGTVGGPVLIPGASFNSGRDRLFFFLGAEYQRQRMDLGSGFMVVPTERQRRGDFGENLLASGDDLNQPRVVYIPAGFPGEGTPAPGNDLSPYATATGLALARLYPVPNYTDPSNRYNYVDSELRPADRRQLTARFDVRVDADTQAYVRVQREGERAEEPSGIFSCTACFVPLPTRGRWENGSYGVAANGVTVVSPTVVNELTLSYAKLTLDAGFVDPSRVSKSANGIPEIGFFGPQTELVPDVYPLSHATAIHTAPPVTFDNDTLQISDKLALVRGAHSIKVGGAFEQANKWQGTTNQENGILLFAPWTPGGTGHELGDLLVGRPFQFEQGTAAPSGHFRYRNIEAFAQDSWRVRRNLTVEGGVRFAYLPNNVEVHDLGAIFLPEYYDRATGPYPHGDVTRLNGVRYVKRGEVPRRLLPNRDPYWLPRVNVAWDVTGTGSTTMRGGIGRFVNRPMGNYDYNTQYVAPNAYYSAINAFDGIGLGSGTGLTYDTIPRVDPYTRLAGTGGWFQDPESIRYTVSDSMSLGVSRRLPWHQAVEVAYVRTRSDHVFGPRDGNAIPSGALFSGQMGNADLSDPVQRVALDTASLATFRPFPAYQWLNFWSFESRGRYDSLQVTLNRPSGRLQYLVAYTLSKNSGTQTGPTCCANPNAIDPAKSEGLLPVDRRHNLVGSFNWMLPETASATRWWRAIANGWQVSGIGNFMSGWPLVLNFSGELAMSGVVQSWFGTPSIASGGGVSGVAPVYLRDPRIRGSRSPGEKLLDIDAIAIPEFGREGPPQSPYVLRSPWSTNLDLTVFKNIRVAKAHVLQLRIGVFNVFNTAYVGVFASGRMYGDIDLVLDTRCKVHVDRVPNGTGGYVSDVCDPTGGFEFTEQTKNNFGTINTLQGHRIVEIAVKYSW